ncbi:uncharacterized protein N7515_004731 [Penicillium bovifimosum]|uniref:Uncharacterized protein n=1 Tax=Penicillium bovifimosum TaxID=126998 RepID=A0A9W9L3L8_9EURO|nr:uncharacterized protein N7515_004731 [Penicillium bovifimosum]KAJ5135453.1 hypothetical protein N7515_004731 [Penicillium bovifimosum]
MGRREICFFAFVSLQTSQTTGESDACRGVEECELCLFRPSSELEGLQAELRSAVANATILPHSGQFQASEEYDAYDHHWTDRTYGGRGHGYNRGGYSQGRGGYGYGNNRESGPRGGYRGARQGNGGARQKRCYICGKPGCWSKYHTGHERKRSLDNFPEPHFFATGESATPPDFQLFLSEFEGSEEKGGPDDDDSHGPEQMLATMAIDDEHEGFMTEIGEVDGTKTISILNNQSTYHFLTKDDIFQQQPDGQTTEVFTLDNRYSSDNFQGIMPDTGAAGCSSAGEPQFKALCRLDPSVKQLDTSRAGEHKINFDDGDPKPSLGTADVDTSIGTISFHVLPRTHHSSAASRIWMLWEWNSGAKRMCSNEGTREFPLYGSGDARGCDEFLQGSVRICLGHHIHGRPHFRITGTLLSPRSSTFFLLRSSTPIASISLKQQRNGVFVGGHGTRLCRSGCRHRQSRAN